jgi:hypothetical protein
MILSKSKDQDFMGLAIKTIFGCAKEYTYYFW